MNISDEVLLDFSRKERTGLDEAVYCAGKSAAHIIEILEQVSTREGRILLTRLNEEMYVGLGEKFRQRLDYDPLSGTAFFPDTAFESCDQPDQSTSQQRQGRVAVIAAGTSDAAVAREASRSLSYAGETPVEITDVGVAGLWRLMERLDDIRSAQVVIAVAGMDAALPTVLAGLISAPVIGVPTSVGYGVAEGGQTALNAMLASCASGLTVTNIDNGYGAACAALRILRMSDR